MLAEPVGTLSSSFRPHRQASTCSPDDRVSEVMDEMSHHRVGQLPVVDNEELIGLVSVGDLITCLYDELETENQHLTAYIHGPS